MSKPIEKLAAMKEGIEQHIEETINPKQPIIIELDSEDTLRLENMILKERSSEMTIRLAEIASKEAREDFQRHIVRKHHIDINTQSYEIDPKNQTLAIIQK